MRHISQAILVAYTLTRPSAIVGRNKYYSIVARRLDLLEVHAFCSSSDILIPLCITESIINVEKWELDVK